MVSWRMSASGSGLSFLALIKPRTAASPPQTYHSLHAVARSSGLPLRPGNSRSTKVSSDSGRPFMVYSFLEGRLVFWSNEKGLAYSIVKSTLRPETVSGESVTLPYVTCILTAKCDSQAASFYIILKEKVKASCSHLIGSPSQRGGGAQAAAVHIASSGS